MKHLRAVALGFAVVAAAGAGQAQAQDSISNKAGTDTSKVASDTAEAAPEEKRSTGLPGHLNLKFNFDAGLGGFGFHNYLTIHFQNILKNSMCCWMCRAEV